MEIIYITIPLVLIVGSLVVAMFIWMAKKGQFDDLDGAGHRILFDDEGPEPTNNTSTESTKQNSAAENQDKPQGKHI
ncbi:cbb3-type cytochrome oxidase assembly protein CcoS [Thiomicrospira microaerophila]|uniref:cbb3-type cytochrome oxidase assembly protein CcoS n=1 Tax=Thiomicrospira microaerophila TaxID=406020 RepID=UPI00200E9496|nr:cbb3-type cytochrome oxidase assembly protein CcoS [Thiomicrospira microaerophila]UQB42054.1 cbb3-type cytochrome oxidase assembly protein CcoS [Thiomicrospira microaerophila]